MFDISGIAYAMGQSGGAAGQGGGGVWGLFPFIAMFVIFYFLLIRPQQKKTKEHRDMVSNLKKGDRIITSGGVHGRVTGVAETTVTVEISEKVRIKVTRGSISSLAQPAANSRAEQQGKG